MNSFFSSKITWLESAMHSQFHSLQKSCSDQGEFKKMFGVGVVTNSISFHFYPFVGFTSTFEFDPFVSLFQ